MGFGPWAALSARGEGPYGARVLVVENSGTHAAVDIAITFEGSIETVNLLVEHAPRRLDPEQTVRLPLRRTRRDAVFRVEVRWKAEGGGPGEFFGVLTAGH